MIEEDWERLSELDKMYILEKEHEMIAEWQQYEEEQTKKLPAKIEVYVGGKRKETKQGFKGTRSFPDKKYRQ